MQSTAATVREYVDALPEDRRAAISAVRRVILENLPEGCEEGMQYGRIGYYVPHSIFPAGYHCNPSEPLIMIGLASQKNHMSLYLSGVYGDQPARERFVQAYLATGRKLDIGQSRIRFRRLEDLPLDAIGQAIAGLSVPEYVARYEASQRERKSGKK